MDGSVKRLTAEFLMPAVAIGRWNIETFVVTAMKQHLTKQSYLFYFYTYESKGLP